MLSLDSVEEDNKEERYERRVYTFKRSGKDGSHHVAAGKDHSVLPECTQDSAAGRKQS